MGKKKIYKTAEEKAFDYQRELGMIDSVSDDHVVARRMGFYDGFIAGAEWQRKQDQQLIELAEDHAMLAGMNKMKEEMMEKAEECELYWDGDFLAIDLNMAALGYSERDKVKVIVVPEENLNEIQNEN